MEWKLAAHIAAVALVHEIFTLLMIFCRNLIVHPFGTFAWMNHLAQDFFVPVKRANL